MVFRAGKESGDKVKYWLKRKKELWRRLNGKSRVVYSAYA